MSGGRRSLVLGLAAVPLLAAAWFFLSSTDSRADFPELTVEALEAQPLFHDLEEESVRLQRQARRQGRLSEGRHSQTPDKINWASDIYDAIEKARLQDKPILLVTFCRENCDQTRDV